MKRYLKPDYLPLRPRAYVDLRGPIEIAAATELDVRFKEARAHLARQRAKRGKVVQKLFAYPSEKINK